MWKPKFTLMRLMLLVAILAVLLRGLLEVPRAVRWSYHTRLEIEDLRSHVEVEGRKGTPDERITDPSLAMELRKMADNHARQAVLNRPSLIGIACILGLLAWLPILAYGAARRSWIWMRRLRN